MRLRRCTTDGSSRRRLTYANVMSTIAVFVALGGGTAFAASKLITGKQIAKGTITATNIKSKSLLAKDFKAGQLPRGAAGATGATGATGPAGPAGPAGSAVGHGTVVVNSVGNPTLNGQVGITSVSNPSTGVYCVGPVIAGHATIVVSAIGSTDDIAEYSNNQCSGSYEIGVTSGGSATNLGNGQGFGIEIP